MHYPANGSKMGLIEKYKKQYQGAYNGSVSADSVDEILDRFGIVNESYRNWLIQTGGGPIGPDWFDGINELRSSQEKLKRESWSISGFVIGWDGAGNPIVLGKSGEIITEDHNFGGVHQVALSFDRLLASNLGV